MFMSLLRAFGIAILLAGAGCSTNEGAAASKAVVRDSAGVRIIENRDPVWTSDTRWTVDSLPSVTIGVEEGDPQREFFRLTDARLLSDGRIVAANSSSNELRYFTGEGEYLCTSGRQGAGPGEFEGLGWLQLLPHDTMLVYSYGGGGRLSIIDPDGRFDRTLMIPQVADERFPSPRGLLPNGALLMHPARTFGMGVTSGTYRDSSLLVIARPGGEELARLGPLPSNEHVVVARENSMTVTAVPFGRTLQTGFGPHGFFLGTSERYEIAHYDTLGRLTQVLRLDRTPEPVTGSAIAHVESARLANSRTDNERAVNEAFFKQMEYPPTMPSYSGMLVDAVGNLWVVRFAYLPGPRTWDVFDADGQLLGEVRMPRYFFPRQITDSLVIGTSRDAMEIERVKVYSIRKGGGEVPESPLVTVEHEPEVTPSQLRRCGVKRKA
jgi:hypothetical protein